MRLCVKSKGTALNLQQPHGVRWSKLTLQKCSRQTNRSSRMTNERQVKANRANAKLSTWPEERNGKGPRIEKCA